MDKYISSLLSSLTKYIYLFLQKTHKNKNEKNPRKKYVPWCTGCISENSREPKTRQATSHRGVHSLCRSLLLQKQNRKQASGHTAIRCERKRSEAHQSMEIRPLQPHFPVTPSFGLSRSSKTGHL